MKITEIAPAFRTDRTPDRETAKLADGARQFEGMLVNEMLKGLDFGGAPGEDGDSGAGASGTIRSFGTEALAKAVAGGGGFGLARRIVQQVTAEKQAHDQRGTKEVKAL